MSSCQYPVSSDFYADFLMHYEVRILEQLYKTLGTTCIDFIDDAFLTAYIPLSNVEPISLAKYPYYTIPKLYGLLDTTALESSQVLQVINQPSLAATGSGTIIGIIDTGIEYTNPLFRLPDGSTRIMGIWDQTIESEQHRTYVNNTVIPPQYGSFYTREQINQALLSPNPYDIVPSRDTDGHGTFSAGVAAGNTVEQPTSFSGAAPDANLVIVKLKPAKQYLRDFFLIREGVSAFQENDIMMGIRYLVDVASTYQMPLVIYLGVGTNQGGHDGTSPLGEQLESSEGFYGIIPVIAAGNEVGFNHHYMGDLSLIQDYDDVELRVGEDETGFCIELWESASELYSVGFISPAGEMIHPIPLIADSETVIPFKLDASTITLNYRPVEAGNRGLLVFMRFQDPSPGLWRIRVTPVVSVSRVFHMWLPLHGFISDQTYFLRPDPDITITEPGNAPVIITISTYNHQNNSIYIHSSRGFTRTNQFKPDITAPGVNVQGPALAPAANPAAPLTFTRRSGSSVAAAITAGAVADLLSWGIVAGNDPEMTTTTIKGALIRGADRNPIDIYPNRQWGYGTLNLYQAFRNLNG